jgi:hypothetical protein
MRCPLCTAVHDPIRGEFIVSHGPPMPEEKFNSRCCHYAKQRGKVGCINPCSTINPDETLEGRMADLGARFATRRQVAEIFIPTYSD